MNAAAADDRRKAFLSLLNSKRSYIDIHAAMRKAGHPMLLQEVFDECMSVLGAVPGLRHFGLPHDVTVSILDQRVREAIASPAVTEDYVHAEMERDGYTCSRVMVSEAFMALRQQQHDEMVGRMGETAQPLPERRQADSMRRRITRQRRQLRALNVVIARQQASFRLIVSDRDTLAAQYRGLIQTRLPPHRRLASWWNSGWRWRLRSYMPGARGYWALMAAYRQGRREEAGAMRSIRPFASIPQPCRCWWCTLRHVRAEMRDMLPGRRRGSAAPFDLQEAADRKDTSTVGRS